MQRDCAESDEADEAREREAETEDGQGDALGEPAQAKCEPSLEFREVSRDASLTSGEQVRPTCSRGPMNALSRMVISSDKGGMRSASGLPYFVTVTV